MISPKQLQVFSSLVILLCLLTGCPSDGPAVTVYISTPKSGGMNWSTPAGKKGLKPYSETDQYVCFDPTDTETLLNYCAAKGAPKN